MKKFIETISRLPICYALTIVLVYGLLTGEYSTFLLNSLRNASPDIAGIIDALVIITYIVGVLTAFATWIVGSLIFHITALLFGGKQEWAVFLRTSAYAIIMLIIGTIISIVLTDGIQLNCRPEEIAMVLQENKIFKIASYVMNTATVLYLAATAVIIHYLHNLKWQYALLSTFLPAGVIYGLIKLISLL